MKKIIRILLLSLSIMVLTTNIIYATTELIEKASNINGYYLLSTFYVPGTIFIAVMLNFQYLVLMDNETRGYIAQGLTNLVSVNVRKPYSIWLLRLCVSS